MDEESGAAVALLARLVGFDTTSARSNLALIAFVEARLAEAGVSAVRVESPDGGKASLYATIGPMVAGGVVLSGHTDVVPVTGQAWTSDPFTLAERDGRLYGRGTCDMKGFLALALAAVPGLAAAPLRRPVHLAFSYDEEVGCLGAPAMIAAMRARLPAPAAVIVGEPTNMQVVTGHKGIAVHRVTVVGHEAHSSLTHLGLSANMVAVELMAELAALARRLAAAADPHSPFVPPEPTLTIGTIEGGTAGNILARRCRFLFDLRTPPGEDPLAILAPFLARCRTLDGELKRRFPQAGVTVERHALAPPLAPRAGDPAEALARRLAGDNGPARVVAYAAEAGQFQEAGMATAICGPGSIEQAHQPDEHVALEQMARGSQFMARLAAWARA